MAEDELSMETIMRLAQQLQGAPPPVVNTSAPSNELGLLGRMFGGGGGGLSTDQQEMQARQAMMAFGSQLSDAASRPLQYGQRRDLMAGVGEANQAAWGSSAAYAKTARDQMKEDREERRAQFNDRMSALDAAAKIGKMQTDLQALRLKRESLDEPGTGAGTATGGAGGGGAGGGAARQFTGDLEKDRQLVIGWESGGDPTALNYVARADPSARARGATASGLYGFVDSTWKEGLQMIGGDAKAYPTAQSAPKSVQDDVFTAIYKARGTAPWDPSKWGKNWAQKPGGGYELVATGTSGTSGTSSPPPTPPPYKVAGPPQPPPTGATAPAVAPAVAPAPAPAEQPALPEAEARAKAAASGQPVPMLGANGQPSGLVIKPDGSMANAPPPTATATAPTATATAPQQPDDTIGLPPGVPGYRAFREANLRQPTPEERRLFTGELTEADKKGFQAQRAELERALQNAQRARQLEGGDASTIVGARTKLAEFEQKVTEARKAAETKGKEIEAGWWKDQEAQLRTAHGKLIEGAETRLTADNAVNNTRRTKAFEGLDSDVKLAGDRIASFDVLRTLSRQVDGNSLVSAITLPNGTPLVDVLAAGKWGSPETLRGYSIVQAYRQMASLAVKEVKEGMSMGSMSDRDLTFIENMIPRLSQDPYTRELGISLLEGAQRRKRDVALRANALMTDGKMNPAQAYAQAQEEAPRIIADVPAKFDINADAITPAQVAERKQWFRDNVRPGQAFRTPDGRVDIYFGSQPKPPGFKHLWELGAQ
jgi:hypothetical protein